MILQAFWTVPLLGQELIVFFGKEQSKEQIEEYKNSYSELAVHETGFNPAQTQPASQTPPPESQSPSGERIKGTARGAAVGTMVGESANDDPGQGAAAGAAAGTMIGGMKPRSQRRQAQQFQQEEAAAAKAQDPSENNRAFSACMEAKGYSVKGEKKDIQKNNYAYKA